MQDKSRAQVEPPATAAGAASDSDADAVQKHFQETLAHQKEHAEELKRKRLNWAVFRFVTTWFGFLLILVVIALLTNLEWARPKIQESMSESFHRRVQLGRLSWVLGLNGLAISTDRLALIEKSGSPFIVSGQSEIGIAFLPLFRKKVIVKHVDFHNPAVYATQLAPGQWNFTDLLVEGPEIRFVQVENGSLHLRNQITDAQLAKPHENTVFANTKWRAYDFDDVNVKLIFPKKNQKRAWPFYLAFKLPRQGADGARYMTSVSLTILGNGTFEEWKNKKASFEFRADDLNPADWRPFIQIPEGFSGLLSVNFKGDGILNQGITGDIKYSAKNLAVTNDGGNAPLFSAKEASGGAVMSLSGSEFDWSKAKISIGGVKLQTEGKLYDWQTNNPKYEALVSADLRNLADLHETSFWQFFPGAKKKEDLNSGSAVVQVRFEGDGVEHQVYTSLKADKVPLANLLANGETGGTPLLSLFQIQPDAPLKGHIEIDADRKILMKDVEIPANGSVLKISGFIDAQKKQHDVMLQAKQLVLNDFDTAELAPHGASASPNASDKNTALMLSGKVNFNAHIKAENVTQLTDVKATLLSATLHSGPATTLATSLNGDIRFDGKEIKFDNIKGALTGRGGVLQLAGTLQTVDKGTCNLAVSGHQVDVAQLVGFARAAHLPLPAKAVNDIQGSARDLDIKVSGKVAQPQLTMSLSPQDIKYVLRKDLNDSKAKILKAVGGNITLSDNVLELRNVIVAAGSSKLIVTTCFEADKDQVVPKLVHVRSGLVDINEIVEYAKSPALPADVRKNLSSALAPLNLQNIDGKAYGDLTIRINKDAPYFIEGVVGLTDASGKFGTRALPFEHLCGLLAFSGDDVVMQDMTFASAGGHYTLSGDIKGFQSQEPIWTAKIGGRARGADLQALLPSHSKGTIEISSNAPLTVRADVTGDAKATNAVFIAIAAAGDQFRIHGDGGGIHQPPGKAMTLDGSLVYTETTQHRSLDLRSWHVTVDESVLQGSARLVWAADTNKKSSMDLILSAPNPVPTPIALAMLMPDVDTKDSAGTVKGSLAVSGEVGNLLTHGEVTLNKVTVPALHVKDVDGKLDSPRWALSNSLNDKGSSEAKLYLSHGDFGNVDMRDLRAILRVDGSEEHAKVSLKDGSATVAGGRVSINGYYVPDTTKWALEIGLDKLQVDQFVSDMIEHSGELTGLADGKIVLSSTADGSMLENLSGSGQVSIYKGTAPRLGQLHEKLQTANLLQQGIFGFNINNVFHSMVPVKSGKFREVSMSFNVDNGVVNIDRLNFDGTDLRLRAAGDWDIAHDKLDLDVAGNIPRVASSILPGAVGEVSRNFTLQKAVRVVTFRKLENLPSIPIIGDIGTDDPRAFTFKIAAALDSPDAVSRSIEKSFKWLPNKPNASAHPLPGL